MLYLEDTYPKNYTSCLKDDKFLNFFFANLKKNDSGHFHDEYVFMSKCWGEINLVNTGPGLPGKSPIVFRHMYEEEDQAYLNFGGDLKVKFDPKKLFEDKETGILMHEISVPEEHKHIGFGSFDLPVSMEILSEAKMEEEGTIVVWKDKHYKLEKR